MDEHPPLHETLPITYKGRRPASPRASAAARGSSKKKNTACELALRKALWASGFRYQKNVTDMPGHPDIVFPRACVAVFCDGDFWHGNNWEARRQRLKTGTNSDYWLAKIQRNMERDRETTLRLEGMGWIVLRFWESEIRSETQQIVEIIGATLARVLDRGGKIP
ncbi:MAG TPA: very short patch repair endonuclease [Thermoanaerobaculia bacterium]